MRRTKAQVTLFILVGVIILLLIGMGIYTYLRQQEDALDPLPSVRLPIEYQSVQNYIEACLRSAGEEALVRVGLQGGYAIVEPARFTITQDPTESDAVRSPGNITTPYWFYMTSPNQCQNSCAFSSKKPGLRRGEASATGGTVEEELDALATRLVIPCLDNFRAFEGTGIAITPTGTPSVQTTITEDDVVFVLNHPLTLAHADSQQIVQQWGVRVPVHLKRMHELASHITDLQREYQFIEEDMLNLIVGFSGRKKEIPPMADTSFDFAPTTFWLKSDVKEHITDMTSSYIPLLQVYQTRNYREHRFPTDPYKGQLFNEGMRVPMKSGYESLAVTFNYLDWWPLYFDLNCQGELCVPQSVSTNFVFPFGVQRYNFAYDLSFPVQIEIYDPDALNGRGYTLRIFLEANIRNNEPFNTHTELLPTLPPRDAQIVCEVGESRIINVTNPLTGRSEQKVEVDKNCYEQPLPGRAMLCDMNKRNSGTIDVHVIDERGNAVPSAALAFSCAGQGCAIGATNENGHSTATYPVCLGGILTVTEPEHITTSVVLDTLYQKNASATITTPRIHTKEFTIKKRLMVKDGQSWSVQGTEQALIPFEKAIVLLTRNGNAYEEEFHSAGSIDREGSLPLRIAPGTYTIDISILSEEPMNIAPEERCVDVLLKKECYTIPGITLGGGGKEFLKGGARFTHTFTSDDLEKDGRIVLYALTPALVDIQSVEDLTIIGEFEKYSSAYRGLLTPTMEEQP